MIFVIALFSVSGHIKYLNTEVVKMLYKGENGSISMFVFLPRSSSTAIDELLDRLSPETLDDIFSDIGRYGPRKIVLSFPKISFEKRSNLIAVCICVYTDNIDIRLNFFCFLNRVFTVFGLT